MRYKKLIFGLTLLLCFSSSSSQSQEDETLVLTLSECVTLAVQNNPSIAVAKANGFPDVGRLVGLDTFPSDRGDQQAADMQGLVSKDLRIESKSRAAGQ